MATLANNNTDSTANNIKNDNRKDPMDNVVEEYLPPSIDSVSVNKNSNNINETTDANASTTTDTTGIANNLNIDDEDNTTTITTINRNKIKNEFSLTIDTDTEDADSMFEPIQRRGSRIPLSSTWLVGIAVVTFDVKIGQKVSTLIPEDACDEEVKKRIALLSLPDSYSGNDGDMLYSFRVRTNQLKYTQSTNRTFLYGHAYFARQKDATAARGFHQSAVVYLTELPYAALFRTLADVTGPLFFELGKGVLKTIVCDISKWPEPRPGVKMTLPVSGMVLSYRVPVLLVGEIDNITTTTNTTTKNNKKDDDNNNNGAKKQLIYPNKLGRSMSDQPPSSSEKPISKFDKNKDDELTSSKKSWLNRSASMPLDSISPTNGSSPAIKTIYDVFDVNAQEHAGYFQSVGLFSTFGTALAPSLWQAWELLICGESIMVYAPSPDLCSRAVFALISTMAPLPFVGDFRPYFTIYDSDFNTFAESLGNGQQRSHSSGSPIPPVILGVTNPFFLKSFEKFPNIISLGQGENNVHYHNKWIKPTVWNRSKVLRKMTEVNCPPSFLVQRAQSLPSNTEVIKQLLPVRNKRKQYDFNSGEAGDNIKQLNRRKGIRSGKIQCVFERRDDTSNSANDGKVGIGACAEDAINNALLRQHFRSLTVTFLQPFERYFGIDFGAQTGNNNNNNNNNNNKSSQLNVDGTDGIALVGFGPYSIECLNLPSFEKKSFLKYLKQSGMPNAFKMVGMKSKFLRLYDKFVETTHFKTWFMNNQSRHREELLQTMKNMRMEIKAKELLCSIAPTLYNMVKGKESGKKSVPVREVRGLAHVLVTIKNEIEKEHTLLSNGDGGRGQMTLITKMTEHYIAVRKLLPERFVPDECLQYQVQSISKTNDGVSNNNDNTTMGTLAKRLEEAECV